MMVSSNRIVLLSLVCSALASARVVELNTNTASGSSSSASSSSLTEAALTETLNGARDFLQQQQNDLDGSSSIDSLANQVDDLVQKVETLSTYRSTVESKQHQIEKLIALANAKQVEHLVGRLRKTMEQERVLRNSMAAQEDDEYEAAEMDQQVITIDTVSMSDLKHRFEIKAVMKESENDLKEWVLRIIEEELVAYKENALSLQQQQQQQADDNASSSGGCPSVIDVVQDVQVALNKYSQDGIGMVDHMQGGEIVHSMTSPTYSPPAQLHELLGKVWWRRYIPEDWERMLPVGWEKWDMGIPSYVYHSLNVKGAKAAPPETILEKKALPGACWPMEGSKGQVTIRLPYPIKVESFSIDHVSWLITPEGMHETAPQRMKVIAYPPCPEDSDCTGLGFDPTDPMEIGLIEYDVDGQSIQTFDSIFALPPMVGQPALDEDEDDEEDDDEVKEEGDDDDDDEGSCSVKAAACSTPPKIDVAAITLKVLGNHGNPEYTCMYRFRVHGEQVYN